MGFKIEKEEYINKTFRMNKKLVDEMEKIANYKNISLNKLVSLCIEYALKNLENDEEQWIILKIVYTIFVLYCII